METRPPMDREYLCARQTVRALEDARRALELAHKATGDGQAAHWIEKARVAVRSAERRAGLVLKHADTVTAPQGDLLDQGAR